MEETITGHAPAAAPSTGTTEAAPKVRVYTRRTQGLQEIERGMSRAAATMGEAVAKTFKTYRDRSNASSFAKRDGAMKDAVKNWTKAFGEGMKEMSDVPYDFVKTVNRSKASKQVRDAAKVFMPPMFR